MNIREHLESDTIAQALEEYMEAYGKTLKATSVSGTVPSKIPRKLKRIIRQEVHAQSSSVRIVRRVLLVAAILFSLLFSITAIAYQEKIFNFFISQQELYLAAWADNHSYFRMTGLYSPSFLPKGYQLYGQPEKYAGLVHMTYHQTDGDGMISFMQAVTGTGWLIDTEEALTVEERTIGDSSATLIVRQDGSVSLLWRDGKLLLSSNKVNPDELIKMAEGIAIVEEPTPE